jgi:hypothetical protein
MAGYEHALFLILLLGFLLIGLRDRHQSSLYLLAGGILLVLLPPFVRVKLPWDLILALVLPWVLWQNADSWLQISWRFPRRELFLWLLNAISLALIVYFIGGSLWLRAAFFGIIAASMFWHLSRQIELSGLLEVIGPLTLLILLVETSLPLDEPSIYIGSLFSGAGIGIILAVVSIIVMKKVPSTYMRWIFLGQAYLAYWIAFALKASPIAAVLISVIVFIEFYLTRSDRKEINLSLSRFDNRFPFYILLALFIFTAWQTHQPIALVQWIEVVLGLFVGLFVTFFGQRIAVHRFEHLSSNWRNSLKLGLFLFGLLLLWPRGPELKPVIILVALGMAVFLPVLSMMLLAVLHDITTQQNRYFPDDF